MSERGTSIDLPGISTNAGWVERGRKTVPEMIALIRRRAELAKRDAEAVLAAKDEDFRVCTFTGIWVRRNREVLQAGRKP